MTNLAIPERKRGFWKSLLFLLRAEGCGAAVVFTEGRQTVTDPEKEVSEFQTELTQRFRTEPQRRLNLPTRKKASRRVRRRFRRAQFSPRRTWSDAGMPANDDVIPFG